ncbi:hypothetical protein DAMA08_051660 [Martiniozyma asiatica (nom. inval.)]|nr:hypothetical protein DAMA08_051660 [Martiniozyma asiatica]
MFTFHQLRFISKIAKPAFVFDIDGVLLHSKNPIPKASKTLSLLRQLSIPYVLLTNGGGLTESSRASQLSKILSGSKNDLVLKTQLIQSHTPLNDLVSTHKRLLLIGGPEEGRQVGESYGFEIIRSVDLVKADPTIWPFYRFTNDELNRAKFVNLDKPIDAIVVINDPRDMGSELQIVLDTLISKNGFLGTRRQLPLKNGDAPSIPIIWSNIDFLWSAGYSLPRFGQGAFRTAVRSIYKQLTGIELIDECWGKPFTKAYNYAHRALSAEAQRIGSTIDPNEIYMVGDNTESDIMGGNNYQWNTILLKTGVYKGDGSELTGSRKPSEGVFDDVWHGVAHVLEKNNIMKN